MKRCCLLALVALVGCSDPVVSSAPAPSPVDPKPASFESLPRGWHLYEEGIQRIGPCRVVANTLATSWRADRSATFGWASEMPHDAIAVNVILVGPPVLKRVRASYPPIARVPLRLPATTASRLEGFPRLPEYRAFGRAPDYLVEVRVDIRNRKPGRTLLRKARSVVGRLRLPDWPKRC